MKNIVFGKVEKVTYVLDDGRAKEDARNYVGKPILRRHRENSKEEILTFEGDLIFNTYNVRDSRGDKVELPLSKRNRKINDYINISESETVGVTKTIFRADLNERHVFVDKLIRTEDIGKDKAEIEYKQELRRYADWKLVNDRSFYTYVKGHGIDLDKVDIDELLNLVDKQPIQYDWLDGDNPPISPVKILHDRMTKTGNI